MQQLRDELAAAGIDGRLIGVTPSLKGAEKWREIQAWMEQHQMRPQDVAIVDDTFDMGPLASRFVRTSPLNGLDSATADALIALLRLGPD